MHQLSDQPTGVDDKTSSVLDVILTPHPTLHRKSAVLKYTLSDHYLIYTHMEFENTKPSVTDHNTVKFRDAPMKSLRQKERSNPWMTHDIIKRDHVHAKATQNHDSRLRQDYRYSTE